MAEQLTGDQTAYTQLRDGAERARTMLWQAAWSRAWEDAEPKIWAGRDALARELAVMYEGDPADVIGAALDDAIEILWTGANEALQLVLRALETAIAFEVRGETPTIACRRLVSEAITTLDEALDTARRRVS